MPKMVSPSSDRTIPVIDGERPSQFPCNERTRWPLPYLLTVILTSFACGGDSPTSPTSTAPPPAPAVTSLTGTVSSAAGTRLSGATVTFLDGPNSGRVTQTNTNGEYAFSGIASGNSNLVARFPSHVDESRGMTLAAGANSLSFTLQLGPPFTISGSGNTVFDVPNYVRRVRVQGSFSGSCQNFVVWIGGRLIVNEILGSCSVASGRSYDGTHQLQTNGGMGETRNSNGVSWSITELR